MKSRVLIFLAIAALITAPALSHAEDDCAKLNQEAEKASRERDLSCHNNKNCQPSSAQSCGCAGVGTDERAYAEIMKKGIEDGCFPVIECMAFSCQCTDGVCKAHRSSAEK